MLNKQIDQSLMRSCSAITGPAPLRPLPASAWPRSSSRAFPRMSFDEADMYAPETKRACCEGHVQDGHGENLPGDETMKPTERVELGAMAKMANVRGACRSADRD